MRQKALINPKIELAFPPSGNPPVYPLPKPAVGGYHASLNNYPRRFEVQLPA